MAAELIDPFDSEAPLPKKSAGGLSDPFDNPNYAPDVPSGKPGWQTEQAPIYSPETSAGIGDTAVASLASDPSQRMQYYSQQRGVPLDRYKVIQGRVAYLDRKGDWRYEESPNFLPGSMKEAGQQIASGAGGAIPAVAGGAVGIASSPLLLTGPPGLGVSMAATGGAAAGAEAVRQGLADKFVAPQKIDMGKILMEGAQAMAGQGVGAGLGALERRYAVPDIGRLNTPAADALEAKAARMNPPIQLTPAESTNLPSLKGQQKMLGNMPGTSDDLGAFYKNRQENQIAPNVNKFLNEISPEASAEVTGNSAVASTGRLLEAAKQARTDAATPAYTAVVKPSNLVPAANIKIMMKDPYWSNEIQKVRSNKLFAMQDHDPGALTVLDQVKKNIDDEISLIIEKQPDRRNQIRLLEERRKELLAMTDDAFPEYPIARAGYEANSPEIDALTEGVLGQVAKLNGARVKRAASVIFSPDGSSVEQIRTARNLLEKKDPQTWQDLKRSWLQMQWVRAGKEPISGDVVNQGPKWRALLLGDADKKAMMREALNPKEYAALQDLADVLEATGRVKPIGSDTAWNQQMQREAKEKATPIWAKVMGNVISPQKWGEIVKDWATERNLKGHAAEVTQIITNPDSRKLLQELKVVSPQSARFKAGVGHLLLNLPSAMTGRTAPSRPDQQQSAKKEGR